MHSHGCLLVSSLIRWLVSWYILVCLQNADGWNSAIWCHVHWTLLHIHGWFNISTEEVMCLSPFVCLSVCEKVLDEFSWNHEILLSWLEVFLWYQKLYFYRYYTIKTFNDSIVNRLMLIRRLTIESLKVQLLAVTMLVECATLYR